MTVRTQTQVFFSLGSNLGDRLVHLRAAADALAPYLTDVCRSRIFDSAPLYVADQPRFLNAVIGGKTPLVPMALLYTLRDLEIQLGRMPVYLYGPRVIDIDLVFYGQERLITPELTIPHRHFAERMFVLRPLADVAPDFVDPLSNRKVRDLLADLDSGEDIHPTGDWL